MEFRPSPLHLLIPVCPEIRSLAHIAWAQKTGWIPILFHLRRHRNEKGDDDGVNILKSWADNILKEWSGGNTILILKNRHDEGFPPIYQHNISNLFFIDELVENKSLKEQIGQGLLRVANYIGCKNVLWDSPLDGVRLNPLCFPGLNDISGLIEEWVGETREAQEMCSCSDDAEYTGWFQRSFNPLEDLDFEMQ